MHTLKVQDVGTGTGCWHDSKWLGFAGLDTLQTRFNRKVLVAWSYRWSACSWLLTLKTHLFRNLLQFDKDLSEEKSKDKNAAPSQFARSQKPDYWAPWVGIRIFRHHSESGYLQLGIAFPWISNFSGLSPIARSRVSQVRLVGQGLMQLGTRAKVNHANIHQSLCLTESHHQQGLKWKPNTPLIKEQNSPLRTMQSHPRLVTLV